MNYHVADVHINQFKPRSDKAAFLIWISQKEFGQRLNTEKPLPRGQFFMSVRIIAKDLEISEKVARKLIKDFVDLEIIKPIKISKNPKVGSIYEYSVQAENIETKEKNECKKVDKPKKIENKSLDFSDFIV